VAGDWVLGVDIGGTNVVVGLVPAEGGPAAGVRGRAMVGGAEASVMVEHIARMTRDSMEEVFQAHSGGRVVGVGVGCPGDLDIAGGSVVAAHNLGWFDVPLRDLMSDALGLPAVLENDANCATYGEWWQGAGQGFRTLVGVTLGTGIGGGIVLDGVLFRGASGTVAEFGHTTINYTGRRCTCGNYGCLEAYASGPNIAARAREGLEAGAESALAALVDGDLDAITAVTVYEALVEGDEYAHEVMVETARILGVGVANIINVLNPDAVVIVGGVTRAGDHLFRPLRSEVRKRAFGRSEAACRIIPGALPETAGVVGAAGVFLSEASRGD